ncbi:hypothetical protein LT679_14045 [Mucilaginibacter roseus]|uniref:Uncharacterized protein n=1 Tax=Mucilaginibacter roseus TaxID=1528868 RepID=A0ABS8U615_9SPHI|nr:hypothetical protein [Mucilaginibacter roseus]MCD8741732.1 hypothetical protein [Mucilaginibacter roseus]
MSTPSVPAYAIVELLMRLSVINKQIGDYKGHIVKSDYVDVKTTGGILTLSTELIMQQFEKPEQITANDLALTADTFHPQRKR